MRTNGAACSVHVLFLPLRWLNAGLQHSQPLKEDDGGPALLNPARFIK